MAVPHVLFFPFPAQGHVPPMLKLAELLSRADLYITFVNTENIHRRFLRSSPVFDRLARLPRFRFRTIPDGLPEDHPRPFASFLDIELSLRTRSKEHYRELLVTKDGSDQEGWPPTTCVVADGMVGLALEVAEEEHIPVMMFRTSSACSVWAYYSIPELIDRGEVPVPDGAEMDELVQGVAGMESFLRRRDLPGLLRQSISVGANGHLQFLTTISKNLARGSALILNTVESLESAVLSHVRSVCPIAYTIGPLQNLLENIHPCSPNQDDDNDNGSLISPNSASLWVEDRSCLMWLNSQPDKSVVYISFGSVTSMSREAFLEFLHGLLNSGHRFLWVVRSDMVEKGKGVSEMVPAELETKTRAMGRIIGWAPQEEVLSHPAVGCFLTHSGWNSTMESIIAGVPMICWPFFADQQINSRFVSEIWKVGVDMKDLYGRSDVEGMVRRVMEGVEAEKLRKSVTEMSQAFRRAAQEGGSSFANFQKLVDHIKSMSSQRNEGNNQ